MLKCYIVYLDHTLCPVYPGPRPSSVRGKRLMTPESYVQGKLILIRSLSQLAPIL